MSWATIGEADVQRSISGAELTAYRQKALTDGQADPLADAMADAVRLVRGYVAGCRENTLGSGETIPDELRTATLALVAEGLANRLPLPSSLTERIDARADEARRLLRDVAACRVAIEQPATASDEVIGAPNAPAITGKTQHFDRPAQDGL